MILPGGTEVPDNWRGESASVRAFRECGIAADATATAFAMFGEQHSGPTVTDWGTTIPSGWKRAGTIGSTHPNPKIRDTIDLFIAFDLLMVTFLNNFATAAERFMNNIINGFARLFGTRD